MNQSSHSKQAGFAAVMFTLVIALLVLIGAAGYFAYAAKESAKKPAASTPVVATASPSNEPTVNTNQAVLAAVKRNCQETAQYSFTAGTIGPNSKPALYSTSKSFALVNGACVKAGTEPGGSAKRYLLKRTSSQWTVIFSGQDSGFPADVIQKYNVPAESDFN